MQSFSPFRSGPRSHLKKYLNAQYGQSASGSRMQQATMQLLRVPCPYHMDDRITNFCKSYQCLLPMCPKCVRAHTEDHARVGTHGDFDTIENCLEYADKKLVESMKKAQQLAARSNNLQDGYRGQFEKLKSEFSSYKDKILSEVLQAFKNYQDKLNTFIDQIESDLMRQTKKLSESISFILQSSRRAIQNLYNSNALDNLISFYATTLIRNEDVMRNCEMALDNLLTKKVFILQYPDNIDTIKSSLQQYLYMGLLDNGPPTPQTYETLKMESANNSDVLEKTKIMTQNKQNILERTTQLERHKSHGCFCYRPVSEFNKS